MENPNSLSMVWKPPTLQSERLLLRPLVEADASSIFAYCSDPLMTQYSLWETHHTLADTLTFIRDYSQDRFLERVPDPLGIVYQKEPGTVIGSLGCHWISRDDGVMEFGYNVARTYWGQGIATEAGEMLLNYVFAHFPIVRVQVRVVPENRQSIRVAEKLGFRYEGTLRKMLFRRNQHWDLAYYSMLRFEWQLKQATTSHHEK